MSNESTTGALGAILSDNDVEEETQFLSSCFFLFFFFVCFVRGLGLRTRNLSSVDPEKEKTTPSRWRRALIIDIPLLADAIALKRLY